MHLVLELVLSNSHSSSLPVQMQMFNSKFDLEVEKMKVEHGFTFCGKFASTFTFYCQGSAQNFHIAIIMIFFIFVLADVMLISSLD